MKRFIPLFMLLGFPVLTTAQPAPKLIVQIVVDQLRGDLIHQYQGDFGDKGFNWLLSHGLDYQNAHHPHAYTVTCVGHSTIATGAYPSLHGIIANHWYDRNTGKEVYCVEDASSKILATSRSKKPLEGSSPRNLLASTLSDEMVLSQKGRAFAVAFKDRAAITLAGHAGKAFWFDRQNGGFVTSEYYYSAYPAWVNTWNQHYEAKAERWELDKSRTSWRFANVRIDAIESPAFGKGFPHTTGAPDQPAYYKHLSMTPKVDELTAQFATHLLRAENLGQTANKTDYLAISFSATDAIGHQFGPESLESEANLLSLDKTLAGLLAEIDKTVGLDNTLIVLSADHGASDAHAWLKTHGMPTALPIDEHRLRPLIEDKLAKRFQLPAQTLQAIRLPYIYLNHQIVSDHKISLQKVNNALIEMLNQQTGIFHAYPLPMNGVEYNWLSRKVDKMAMSERSGDIYLVQPPYQAPEDKTDEGGHGTPWRYDSYVPLLFVNPAFTAQRISRSALTNDIAPTLAAILQIKAPSAAVTQPLAEVMAYFEKNASS